MHDAVVQEQRQQRTRAEEVADIERELLDLYRDPRVDAKPELLAKRGGAYYSEAALQLVGSIWSGRGDVQVVDVRNNGAVPGLPGEAVVELPCRVDRSGAASLRVDAAPAVETGLMSEVAAYEALAVEAAITGDRETAFLALMAHPLIGQADLAESLLADVLAANAAQLPRFA
jgi:6-phospho-beta-glucosidase